MYEKEIHWLMDLLLQLIIVYKVKLQKEKMRQVHRVMIIISKLLHGHHPLILMKTINLFDHIF